MEGLSVEGRPADQGAGAGPAAAGADVEAELRADLRLRPACLPISPVLRPLTPKDPRLLDLLGRAPR